jgi:hypothetical protein
MEETYEERSFHDRRSLLRWHSPLRAFSADKPMTKPNCEKAGKKWDDKAKKYS